MDDSLTPIGMLERVVKVAERAFGPDHPATESRRQRLLQAREEAGQSSRPPASDLTRRRHDA